VIGRGWRRPASSATIARESSQRNPKVTPVTSRTETKSFHGETVEPTIHREKILSPTICATCSGLTFVVLWRTACISAFGSLRLVWCVVCLATGAQVILTGRARGNVGKSGGLALLAKEQDCAEQLARFFRKQDRFTSRCK